MFYSFYFYQNKTLKTETTFKRTRACGYYTDIKVL